LKRKLAYFPALAAVKFCVVLSDIVEANVRFWEQHPRFQELQSLVDFVLMEEGEENRLWLRRAQQDLQSTGNPLVVVANYFFDSIPHDEFRLTAGRLEECLLEIVPKAVRPNSSPDRLDARDIELDRSYRPIEAATYYENPQHRDVLLHYQQNLDEGSLTVPVAALDCLDRLRQLGKLLLLSSDRGFTSPAAMAVYPDHPLALHEGCFSHMVNYHALGLTFQSALSTRRHLLDGVQTVCFSDYAQGPHLDYAFRERLERSNSINNANELFALVRDKPPFNALLGFVRLNLNDPNAFSAVAKRLSESLPRLSYGEHQEIVSTLEQVWDNDFYFKGSPNITFWIAHLYACLGLFDRALWFYDKTIERQGADAMLRYLQGSCWHALGNHQEARNFYQQALQLQPDMAEARQALHSLP
jgi:tetratricopeptide (TPR) repeat protein